MFILAFVPELFQLANKITRKPDWRFCSVIDQKWFIFIITQILLCKYCAWFFWPMGQRIAKKLTWQAVHAWFFSSLPHRPNNLAQYVINYNTNKSVFFVQKTKQIHQIRDGKISNLVFSYFYSRVKIALIATVFRPALCTPVSWSYPRDLVYFCEIHLYLPFSFSHLLFFFHLFLLSRIFSSFFILFCFYVLFVYDFF